MKRPLRTLACVLALVLSAAACADSSGVRGPAQPDASATGLTADEQTAVTNLDETMKDQEDSPRIARGSQCLATGMVDKLGLEKLKQYRFLNEDLSANENDHSDMPESDAATYVDVMLGCVDYRDIVADMVAPDAPDSDPNVRRCTDAVSEDDVREALLTGASGNYQDFEATPFYQKMMQAGCGFGN